jgi:hypothetical protein
MNKIDQKIVGYKVKGEEPAPITSRETMHEGIQRPEVLKGKTYKIKPPGVEHALYVTINDLVLNEGTDHEETRPYEMFVNSKNMDHYQWVVALTRVVSAVFRKGGSVEFLVEELSAVFDPNGGHRRKGGKWMNSMVAELGRVLEEHLDAPKNTDKHMYAFIEAKKAELGGIPETAQNCSACGEKAVVLMDGCMTCLSCGASKCN